jgi:small subunit ribosomal protein S4
MARYKGPRVRISRRFGSPIFGASKYLERKNYPPGIHGPKSRRKKTDYAVALDEKQKLRYTYGLLERQFRRVFEIARKKRGATPEQLMQLLETRLDNVVFRLGFATTRPFARQLINHGHVKVNARRVSIPSYNVKTGDTIEAIGTAKSKQLFQKNIEATQIVTVPDWLTTHREAMRGQVVRIPTMDDMKPNVNVRQVVEFYSR